jgi:DNA primase
VALISFTPHEVERYYRYHLRDLRLSGREFRAPCPLHGSDHRIDSLAIDRESGRWYCHSGCAAGGSMIEFEKRIAGTDFRGSCARISVILGRELLTPLRPRAHVIARYDYTDASGKLLYQIERLHPKRFRARRPDGHGGWIYNLGRTPRVLYNLPAILRAPLVFVTEGEKDANSLISRGLTSTTCVFGAGKWCSSYNCFLAGKDVIILPDNDQAGRTHGEMVGRSLVGVARSIKMIELPAQWRARSVTESSDVN